MCLYTRYIENRKYKPTRKNGYNPPLLKDGRLKYVPVKCGKCIECRKEKKREWLARLSEEIRNDNKCTFVTLTFNDQSMNGLYKDIYGHVKKDPNHEEEHMLTTTAVRRFLERIRKITGKSIKHWLITEKGEDFNRIHLHGLLWGNPKLLKMWNYGYTYTGTFVNEKTINYITKYMLKTPEKDRTFVGKIYCSAGLGKGYLKRLDAVLNKYKEGRTNETYRTRKGTIINLPQYYRNKIYSEDERERLWIEKQERGYRYICGEKVSTDNLEEWENLTKYYQERAQRIYGENPEEWDKEKQKRRLQRMKAAREKQRKVINKLLTRNEHSYEQVN